MCLNARAMCAYACMMFFALLWLQLALLTSSYYLVRKGGLAGVAADPTVVGVPKPPAGAFFSRAPVLKVEPFSFWTHFSCCFEPDWSIFGLGKLEFEALGPRWILGVAKSEGMLEIAREIRKILIVYTTYY